jgi:hypothetical protein
MKASYGTVSTFDDAGMTYLVTIMASEPPIHPYTNYTGYAATIAPAAIGCALGILFGRGMERKAANVTALTLLAAGVVVAGPAVVDIIQRAANRPSTRRGSQRRLEGIRDGGLPEQDVEGFFAPEGEFMVTR